MLKAKNPKGKMRLNEYLELACKCKYVGRTAVECHGWFYPLLTQLPLHKYTPIPELSGYISIFTRFHYLKDYDESIGFMDSGCPNDERVICDLLKYDKELNGGVYIGDALMGYLDDDDYGREDFSKVEEMMSQLDIPLEALEDAKEYMYDEG